MEKENARKLLATIRLDEEAKNPNNAYFRSANTGKGFKGMFMKKEYKEYKDRWIEAANKAVETANDSLCEPYTGPVAIKSTWCFGTLRKKDVQNCGKLEYDALNDTIYKDDSQIMEIYCSKTYQKGKPYCEIEVWTAPDLEDQWPQKK